MICSFRPFQHQGKYKSFYFTCQLSKSVFISCNDVCLSWKSAEKYSLPWTIAKYAWDMKKPREITFSSDFHYLFPDSNNKNNTFREEFLLEWSHWREHVLNRAPVWGLVLFNIITGHIHLRREWWIQYETESSVQIRTLDQHKKNVIMLMCNSQFTLW